MRFIENADLREWVKENLKKTIFQKAHALAAQTGCEILVKMKDINDNTPHQYYGTGSLRRIYIGNALRRVPGEKPVSGETGLPLVDQSVQFGDIADVGFKDSYPEIDSGGDHFDPMPIQLSVASGNGDSQMESDLDAIKIKEEVMDQSGLSEIDTQTELNTPFSMADNIATTQMGSYQAVPTGITVASNSHKYSIPISPKPYQCGVCGKAFRSVQVLQKHTHTFHMRPGGQATRGRGRGRGSNPAAAKTVSYKQQTQQALMSRQAELQSDSFTCVICSQTFDRVELLSEHITNSHSDGSMGGSLSSSLPSLPTQFDEQLANTSGVDLTQAQMSGLQFPPTQNNPIDLPSGSMTFGQQQMMQQSPFKFPHADKGSSKTPNKASSSPGSPGSALKRKWSFQKRPEITIRTIMSAILLSAGPISTHYAVRRYGPKYLRNPSIPKEQYVIAAMALQDANLGMLVTVKNAPGLSDTFIKKSPTEIIDELKVNGDLATLEEYTFRFQAPPPACITPTMQTAIIQNGLLPAGSFSVKIKPRSLQPPSPPPSQIFDSRLQMMDPSHGLMSFGTFNEKKLTPITAPSFHQIHEATIPSTSSHTTSILEARLQMSDAGMFEPSSSISENQNQGIFQTASSFNEKKTSNPPATHMSETVHIVEPEAPSPSPPPIVVPEDEGQNAKDGPGQNEPQQESDVQPIQL